MFIKKSLSCERKMRSVLRGIIFDLTLIHKLNCNACHEFLSVLSDREMKRRNRLVARYSKVGETKKLLLATKSEKIFD